MARQKKCAQRRCNVRVSKTGEYCSKHRGTTATEAKEFKRKPKTTFPISEVDPIYEYEMSESLKEETRNLRNYFHQQDIRSTRFRCSDDFSDRPEVKAEVHAFSQKVFDFLKSLPGSAIHGKRADKYEIFDWAFIHAPPKSRTAGSTHVDMLYFKSHKAYTVWMPIDEVTEDNGCVTMFLKSQGTPIDYRNPNQDSKFEKTTLTGKLGKVVMFDSRIHHRSEANKTDSMRSIVLFSLKLKGFRVQGESGKELVAAPPPTKKRKTTTAKK